MGGLVVRSETQVFAAMVLVTLHFLSGCSPACEEPVGFVKECLVVDEDVYVDPEGTDDSVIDDPNLFEQTTDQHCQKFEALYEDVLANVIECLELQADRAMNECWWCHAWLCGQYLSLRSCGSCCLPPPVETLVSQCLFLFM